RKTEELQRQATDIQQEASSLQQVNDELTQENLRLQTLVEKLKKLLTGKKRERFQQLDHPKLPFSMAAEELKQLQEQAVEKITYTNARRPQRPSIQTVHHYPPICL